MNEPSQNIELFDAYVNRQLTVEENKLFEARLVEDIDFASEFELYKGTLFLVKREGIRAELRELTEQKENQKSLRVPAYWAIGIAASILLAIFFWPSSNSSDDLFTQYYEPYPDILTLRSGELTIKGMNSYTKGEYARAIDLLSQINNGSDTINFYLGISYLSSNKPGLAINYFDQIEESSIFSQQRRWYVGLANILLGRYDAARHELYQVRGSDFKYAESQKLLEDLE